MTTYKGYVCLEHDDSPLTAYTEAYKKHTHKFSVQLISGFISYFNQFAFRDKIGATVYYWDTLWAGQMREMFASGRVSFENHSLSHMDLAQLATPETAAALEELELACLSARDWIENFTGAKPVVFTPPYISYHTWQAAYFDVWFRYWVAELKQFDANAVANLNAFPLPTQLHAHYLGGAAGTPAVTSAQWGYVDAVLTDLETNKKLCIILMHDITTLNTATVGRNILPTDYAILMQKLAAIQADGHLITESELI